jgi:hypothetical protein
VLPLETSEAIPGLAGWGAAVRNFGVQALTWTHAAKATRVAARMADLAPVLNELRNAGASLRGMARELNERGIAAPRGGAWSAAQVRSCHSATNESTALLVPLRPPLKQKRSGPPCHRATRPLITGREGLLGLRRDDPPSIYAPDGKLRSLSVSIRAYLPRRGLVTDGAGAFSSRSSWHAAVHAASAACATYRLASAC